jgi:hypothetical protein
MTWDLETGWPADEIVHVLNPGRRAVIYSISDKFGSWHVVYVLTTPTNYAFVTNTAQTFEEAKERAEAANDQMSPMRTSVRV